MLRMLLQLANRRRGWLLASGIAAVAAYNWRLWQRDRILAERLRAERAPVPALARTPRVSALVAAWNEAAHIEAHIESFLALRYPDIELILCAGGTDGTLALAQRYAGPRVTVLEQLPDEGKQRALARCLEHAAGEIIYLTDADCLFDDEALVRLLAPIVNEGEHAATGGSRPYDKQRGRLFPDYLWSLDRFSAAKTGPYTKGLLGRNASITRQAIDHIGGLNFEAPTGTDYHLARRLINGGYQIRHVYTSIVATEYPETLCIYWRKQSRWMRTLLLYSLSYRAYDQFFAILRTVILGTVMLMLPITGINRRSLLRIWLLLALYSTLSKMRYMMFNRIVSQQPVVHRNLLVALPMSIIDFAVWLTPFVEVLISGTRKRW